MFRFPTLCGFDLIDAHIILLGIIAGLAAIFVFT